MNKAFLGIALAAHELWLRDDERGNRFVTPAGADLRSADLRYANLRYAYLSCANLSSANLSCANRIIGPQRSDGYLFTFCTKTQRVLAGCRAMTITDYIAHCDTYADPMKKVETLAILKCLELLAAARVGTDTKEGRSNG